MLLLLVVLSLGAQTDVALGGQASGAARLLTESEQDIRNGDYPAAIERARAAAEAFRVLSDRTGQARALDRVGQAALYAGNYDVATDAFKTAAGLSAATGNRDGQAEQLANLGNVYFFVGRYSDAALSYDAALALADDAKGAAWARGDDSSYS